MSTASFTVAGIYVTPLSVIGLVLISLCLGAVIGAWLQYWLPQKMIERYLDSKFHKQLFNERGEG